MHVPAVIDDSHMLCKLMQVMLVTTVAHVHYKPFVDSAANDLNLASLMLNFFTLFAALLIKVHFNFKSLKYFRICLAALY
jgi:hypothetical protein